MTRKTFLLATADDFSKLYTWLYGSTLCLLFVLSLVIDKGSDVLWINGHHTVIMDRFFASVTHLGSGLIFVPILLVMLFIRFEYAIMCVVLSAGHGILISIFKKLLFPGLERPRNFLDNKLLHFIPGVEVHGSNSFPSGHTTTIFCAALFVTLVSKNKATGILMLILALSVGYSRIYLLQHFLVDVAAGAVLGCFTTYMVWQVFNANQKPQWMNSHLTLKVVSRKPRPARQQENVV